MYKTINVRVTLVGMVTWNVKDEIIVSTNSRLTLESLSTYRFNDVMKAIPNDNVQLMTGVIFNDGAGNSFNNHSHYICELIQEYTNPIAIY